MVVRFSLLKIGEILGLWVLYVIGCLVGEFVLKLDGLSYNVFELYVLVPVAGLCVVGILVILISTICENMRRPTREECFVFALCVATVCIYCEVGKYVEFWMPPFVGAFSAAMVICVAYVALMVSYWAWLGAKAFIKSNIELARRIK